MGVLWLARNAALPLALACPGTATRQLSANFPSPRFVRRTFFRRCGCLLGPVAGIGIGFGARCWHRDVRQRALDETRRRGPQKVPPIHFRPQQKIQPALKAVLYTVFTAG